MPVGKRLDRTHPRSLNDSKVLKDSTRNLVGGGGSKTILTGPTRQGPGPLPLGPAPVGERTQLTPSKGHGPCQPVQHQARTQ